MFTALLVFLTTVVTTVGDQVLTVRDYWHLERIVMTNSQFCEIAPQAPVYPDRGGGGNYHLYWKCDTPLQVLNCYIERCYYTSMGELVDKRVMLLRF